jgi:hypothetical protein
MNSEEMALGSGPTLPTIKGGLQIGAARDLGCDTSSFGLIDDVPIYNRAVKP